MVEVLCQKGYRRRSVALAGRNNHAAVVLDAQVVELFGVIRRIVRERLGFGIQQAEHK